MKPANADMQSTMAEHGRVFKVRGTEILATDTLAQYRQKLARIALDEMYQFVAVLDAQGTLLEVNRAALEGAGLKLADVEGKPFWDCFWWTVSRETQETLKIAVGRAAQGEFIRYDAEIYGRAHGKETIIIDFSMIPVKDEAGNVVFIVPEGRDITEKKAYEREIAKKNEDLQALLKRIRELDEIKTQFFANVSHELRTPLQLIIGPADRLSANDATLRPEQRQESARIIARMLLKHVNDLLDISKLEAGKLKIELQDTDVASLIRFTASHFDVLAADRKISFLVEAQEELVSTIDREKIQRLVMNLLSNAFKFVPDGGKVRTRLRQSKKDLVISIEDSGPGVEPALRQAIFERFRQGEGDANRQFGGTGLGLAIAKEFVEMHKGELQVLDSELGGACFQLTLPIPRLSQATPASTLPATLDLDRAIIEGNIEALRPSPSLRDETTLINFSKDVKHTVLVVEDNAEMNRFIAQSLASEYQVISAFDGQQGLERALVSNLSLIVVDMMMPKVNGVQMIDEMWKYPELADVPIILLSAKVDEELKIKLLEEGVQDFMTKPFSEKELLVRVRNLIEHKRMVEALSKALHTDRARRRAALNLMEDAVLARQSMQTLNMKLRESEVELNDALITTKKASLAKSDFLSSMSHELRTPLNGILGFAQLMESGSPEPTPSQQRSIEQILKAGWYLLELINDILDLAQIDSGNLSLSMGQMSLVEVMRECEIMIEPQARKYGVSVIFHQSDCANFINADSTRMKQILINLLSNAIKYNKEGGTVVLDCTVNSPGRLRLRVKDTGEGLAPEKIAQLFQPFNRLGKEATTKEGTGIGLVVCKRLIELMGGEIGVESTVGVGSVFWIELNLTAEPQLAAAAKPTTVDEVQVQADAKLHTLLYVENNPTNLMLVEDLLARRPDIRMLSAVNGNHGVEIARASLPDVILMDINLPDISGITALGMLADDPSTAQIPVIALSANAMPLDIEKGLEAGFFRYLTKPIKVNEFMNTLNEALKCAQTQSAAQTNKEKQL